MSGLLTLISMGVVILSERATDLAEGGDQVREQHDNDVLFRHRRLQCTQSADRRRQVNSVPHPHAY